MKETQGSNTKHNVGVYENFRYGWEGGRSGEREKEVLWDTVSMDKLD